MSSEEATQVGRAGQRRRGRGRWLRVVLPTVAVLGVGSAVTVAAIPSSDATFTACYANIDNGSTVFPNASEAPGALRIIDPSRAPDPKGSTYGSRCQPGETQISWNQKGPEGPAGAAGAAGAPGAAGAAGSTLIGGTAVGLGAPAGGGTFLDLPGVDGESADAKHKGEIELESVAFGASNPNSGGAGSGAGAGKVALQDFHFVKKVDQSSPKLFLACTTGKHFPNATITVSRKAGGSQKDFLKITLKDVLVSSISTGVSTGGAPTESVTLQSSKVTETFLGGVSKPITITAVAPKALG